MPRTGTGELCNRTGSSTSYSRISEMLGARNGTARVNSIAILQRTQVWFPEPNNHNAKLFTANRSYIVLRITLKQLYFCELSQ